MKHLKWPGEADSESLLPQRKRQPALHSVYVFILPNVVTAQIEE